MKKVLKLTAFIIMGLILGVGIYYQIKVERYLSKQKKEYNILENKKRVTYCPYILFIIQHEVFGMHEELRDMKVPSAIYSTSNEERPECSDTIYRTLNITYDTYFAYAYFTSDEIDSITNDTLIKYGW